jgi:hypothetical protein
MRQSLLHEKTLPQAMPAAMWPRPMHLVNLARMMSVAQHPRQLRAATRPRPKHEAIHVATWPWPMHMVNLVWTQCAVPLPQQLLAATRPQPIHEVMHAVIRTPPKPTTTHPRPKHVSQSRARCLTCLLVTGLGSPQSHSMVRSVNDKAPTTGAPSCLRFLLIFHPHCHHQAFRPPSAVSINGGKQ